MVFVKDSLGLKVDGVRCEIKSIRRVGRRRPLLLLHGFGSSKEDYADLVLYPQFSDRPVYAYDAPGFGESSCGDPSAASIPFLRDVASTIIEYFDLDDFHLVGHSMGGLTALLLACSLQGRIVSFTNIEGNLSPEDCFLSRQIFAFPTHDGDEFLDFLTERVASMPGFSHSLYAANLKHKVNPQIVAPVFRSMVDISDNGELLEKFVKLPCRKMFVHGQNNCSLSYLGQLKNHGVRISSISKSGHFPMYSNPPALWASLGDFINQSEGQTNDG